MAIIREVLDAISDVTEAIDNIQKISKAVRDGREYLVTKHPEVAPDLAAMCEEMQKTLVALASASSIVTHFSFVLGKDLSKAATEFNKEFSAHKVKAENVRQQLNSMRGHCHVIKNHADKIRNRAEASGLKRVFEVLGLHSEQKETELAAALEAIYDDEMALHKTVRAMDLAIQETMKAVRSELGPPGTMDPSLVPNAARVLGEHVAPFSKLETSANYASLELQASIDEL